MSLSQTRKEFLSCMGSLLLMAVIFIASFYVATANASTDKVSLKGEYWAHTKLGGGNDIIAIYPQSAYNLSEQNCLMMRDLHDKTFKTRTFCQLMKVNKLTGELYMFKFK